MIFDSLGIGEMGLVLVLAVVLIEPKKLGKVMKEFAKLKRKALQIQTEIKTQFDVLNLEEEAKDRHEKLHTDKSSMRTWGRERVAAITSEQRSIAAQSLIEKIKNWPTYQHAKVVACFAGTLDEIDTEPLLKQILADQKILLLPYVAMEENQKVIRMALVSNLELDLSEGTFGILEPKQELRIVPGSGESNAEEQKPQLIFVPGTCFDLRGGRIGQGLGFYDRYLPSQQGIKAGLGFEVQITQKNLTLDSYDQMMDVLISEERITVFSAKATTQENST